MTTRTFDSQPAILEVTAAGLQPDEVDTLKRAINAVRAGELEYYVKATNKKQTKSRKRMPNADYVPDPVLVPHAHVGWLVAAPKNQKHEVYLHIYDEARAKSEGDNYGHTRLTLRGLRSFRVEKDPRTGEEITRPGPLADPDVEAQGDPRALEPCAAPVASYDPHLAAQALMAQSQAFMAQGQAFMAQAMALMLRAGQNTPL